MEPLTDQQLDEWRAFGLRVDLQEMAWLVDEVRQLKGIARDQEQVLMETEAAAENEQRRLGARVAELEAAALNYWEAWQDATVYWKGERDALRSRVEELERQAEENEVSHRRLAQKLRKFMEEDSPPGSKTVI